ncbi:uncharacterized protein LOC144166676 [Haemaphysalis longicornis]
MAGTSNECERHDPSREQETPIDYSLKKDSLHSCPLEQEHTAPPSRRAQQSADEEAREWLVYVGRIVVDPAPPAKPARAPPFPSSGWKPPPYNKLKAVPCPCGFRHCRCQLLPWGYAYDELDAEPPRELVSRLARENPLLYYFLWQHVIPPERQCSAGTWIQYWHKALQAWSAYTDTGAVNQEPHP